MFNISKDYTIDNLYDTFIQGILRAARALGRQIPPWYFFGTTGHGARLTLAMDVRRGKEIGHPSSAYIWDIISVAENCFTDAGIDWELFVGSGYVNRARTTSAQMSRTISDNVNILEDNSLINAVEGPVLVATVKGKWVYSSESIDYLDINPEHMPFGPVVLKIKNIDQMKLDFPDQTLSYLIKTLERGEEPMEIVGKGDYSAVSGWKAYARWMQVFSVPLPDIQHDNLQNIPKLLYERRDNFAIYLQNVADTIEDEYQVALLSALANRYRTILPKIQQLQKMGMGLETIRDVYLAEQKTLPTYKKIDSYITHDLNQ